MRWLSDVTPLIAEAIRYSLLGEGKRLRAILLIEAYRACGGVGDASELGKVVKKDDWNTYRILFKGYTMENYINGTLMARMIRTTGMAG